MKIIDCFIFYNEIDLLNYRLNTLDEVVDYFIIVESTHTHRGFKKEMFFEKNKELFEKFENKIINIIVDDFPYKYPNVNIKLNQQWENERYQRNCINKGLEKINLDCSDIIIITDVDEIPDREMLKKIKNNEIDIQINELEMDLYYCNLNHKKNSKWPSARIIKYKMYKTLSLNCNDIRFYNCPKIVNAGWHLSYFGDSSFIQNKIKNMAHQEFNNENFTNIDKINKRIENFCDIFDRDNEIHNKVIKISVKDNNRLPYEYEKYLNKYYNL
jgi:beta-1,4-mannosyl-glycoprotein beta-1,4-N-acetylglucosaminyltransferase